MLIFSGLRFFKETGNPSLRTYTFNLLLEDLCSGFSSQKRERERERERNVYTSVGFKGASAVKLKIPNFLWYFKILLTPWLIEPGGSIPHSQGLSNNTYLSLINQNPRIDTHFFKIPSNTFLLPMPWSS